MKPTPREFVKVTDIRNRTFRGWIAKKTESHYLMYISDSGGYRLIHKDTIESFHRTN